MNRKFICIKQQGGTDCGAACLAMISKYYKKNISVSLIRELTGTDNQGTSIYGMLVACKKLGFNAKAFKGEDKYDFMADYTLPAIAYMYSDNGQYHYVVIYKKTKKYIIISDPLEGIKKYKIDEFANRWAGAIIVLLPDINFESNSEKESIFYRFIKLLLPQRKLLFEIFIASLFITIFGIFASFYYTWIMDSIVPNMLKKTLITVSLATIGLYFCKIVFEYVRNYLTTFLSQKLDIPLLLGYYRHVIDMPMSFFVNRNVGEIISRFMDASAIRDAIASIALTIMIDSIMVIVGGVVLLLQERNMFFVTVLVAIIYAIIVFVFKKPIRKYNRMQMEKNAQLTSYLVESLNGAEIVKAFNAEDVTYNKTDKILTQNLKLSFTASMVSNLQLTLTNMVSAIGGVIIIWTGTVNVIKGNISLGQLITYNTLLGYFLDPIKNIINLQPKMESAIVAAERLCEILDLPIENKEDSKINTSSLKQNILFKNVSFRYGTRKCVLENLNFEILPGKRVAFVGRSGSGKTTIAKLIMKFYECDKGNIYIGENNILDLNVVDLRNKIAYISQNVFLFSGTIIDNLKFGNNNVTYDEIINVCKACYVDEFVDNLPLRYNTLVEENGGNLSGGQKQRIAIARALLRKPDILILDEATSNLDTVTEKSIEKTINSIDDSITIIKIAHRLSTIMDCDNIIVLDEGKIVERGNHHELINYKGKYYQLWKEQSIGE